MYALTLLSIASGVAAWGNLGHETIAYVAQNFVADDTASWAQNILGDTSDSYLANVATWADSYRYTKEGRFSAPYHFIDAEDNPPNSCSVDFDRDCGKGGCSVSAIANYTTRVQSQTLPDNEVFMALKWIIHFVGDITQPLHDEAYEVGGNDVDVTFNGASTNLHHIWDTNMPEQLRGGYSLAYAQDWGNNLTTEIESGIYSSQASSWLSHMSLRDSKATALHWATDANAYVCSVVMPNGADALSQQDDLYPDYYNSAVQTFELQIAKAGYRLAKWLDLIAANSAGNSRRSEGWQAGRRLSRREEEALSGRHLLPPPRTLSPQKLRREVVGWGCSHAH